MISGDQQIKRYKKICENVTEGSIVDFGSSQGDLHEFLRKSFPKSRIVGIDITNNSDIMYNLNVFPYPFIGSSADTIIAGEIIEHLENPLEFLKECYRILKKGGRLIMTTPNMMGLQYFKTSTDTSHIYGWNAILLKNLIEKTKFKIAKLERMTTYWNRNILFRMICFVFPSLQTTLFAVLKKEMD